VILPILNRQFAKHELQCQTHRQSGKMQRMRTRHLGHACSWLISFTMAISELCFMQIRIIGNTLVCSAVSSLITHIWIYFYCTFVLFLFSSILLLNILILRRLSKPQAIQANLPEAQRHARSQIIGKIVKMVLWTLLLYSSCYLPDFAAAIIYISSGHKDILHSTMCINWLTFFFTLTYICM